MFLTVNFLRIISNDLRVLSRDLHILQSTYLRENFYLNVNEQGIDVHIGRIRSRP